MLDNEISVVIPYFNREATIAETVASIENQSIAPKEIIIVNDGSSSSSTAHLKEIASGNTAITIIEQENAGVSSARNAGILRATGKYIAFLDSDDVWEKGHLESSCTLLSEHSSTVAAHGGFRYITEDSNDTRYLEEKAKNITRPWKDNGASIGKNGYLIKSQMATKLLSSTRAGFHMSSLIICAERLARPTPLFDSFLVFAEDVDFLSMIACKGDIIFIDQQQTRYRLHSGNTVDFGSTKVLVSMEKLILQQRALEKRLVYSTDPAVKKELISVLAKRYLIIAQNYSNKDNYQKALDWYRLSFKLDPSLSALKHILAQRLLPRNMIEKLYA